MMNRLKSLLAPPTFEDEKKANAAILVHIISATMLTLVIVGLIIIPIIGKQVSNQGIVAGLAFGLVSLSGQVLLRTGRVRAASLTFVIGSLIINTLALFTLGGIAHPFTSIYFLIILIAGLLLGGSAASAVTALIVVATLGIWLAEESGIIDTFHFPRITSWLIYTLLFVFATILLYLSLRSLNQALERANANQKSLEESNRSLDEIRANLEKRVAERTALMEQRSNYLEASAEIVRVASSFLDADQMLQQVVNLICEHFELYYVGLFLTDKTGEWAVLHAGTGEQGKQLLARGQRIRITSGIIGWSIGNAEPRISLVAGFDAARLAVPELPDTRSEAALPLRARGEVIGALSVQSSIPDAFDEDKITVLQTVADQIAVAVQNATLFAESQASLEASRSAFGEVSRQAWSDLIHTRKDWGYRFAKNSLSPISGPWKPEMVAAAKAGQHVLLGTGSQSPAGHSSAEHALAVPIKVRNQVVGVLSARKTTTEQRWTSEEITVLEMLIEQIGQAIESARLYQETQQRADQERMVGEITAHMRESLDIDMVLQTAVREMGQALGLAEVKVSLAPDTGAQG